MKDVEQRLAALEAENASLRAEIAALRPANREAPKSEDDEGVTITTHRPGAGFVMPNDNELHTLHAVAVSAYPRQLAGCDFDQFENAFRALGAIGRADKPDAKKSLSWWIDHAEDLLRAVGASTHMSAQAFVGAMLAHGDISFGPLDDFPYNLEFGLVRFGGRPAKEAWRQVVARGVVLAPAAVPTKQPPSPSSVRYV